MKKSILLVEDYEEKAKNILSFLKSEFSDFTTNRCSSYNAAQEEIFENSDKYDLILLDMSMTTFDLASDVSGGIPEASAGQDILEGMFLRKIPTPVIVVTMYNVFGRKELTAFDKELAENYPQNYKSYVFYSSQRNEWKKLLKSQIKKILNIK